MLSFLPCVLPFAPLARGDLCPDDCDDPFAKLREGDCEDLEVSLSRRIFPSCLRLRFEMWRDKLPRVPLVRGSSSASSLAEKLCLRFPAVVWSDDRIAAADAWSEARAAGAGWLEGAEMTGEEEAGDVGVDGWSEAAGEGGFGAISSARTNAGSGYPQMTRVWVGGSAVPGGVLAWGLGREHRQLRGEALCWSARGVGVDGGEVGKLAEVSSEVWSSWRCHEPSNDDAVVGAGHL